MQQEQEYTTAEGIVTPNGDQIDYELMKLFNLNEIAPSAQAILINNGVVNVSSLVSLLPED